MNPGISASASSSSTAPGVQGLRAFSRVPLILEKDLPRYIFKSLAFGLYKEGKAFKTQYRDSLASKLKTGGKRVGNAFKVYTTGSNLSTLSLGIFTKWLGATIYETGGVIVPTQGRFLVIPVTPKAYTSKGRIKATWRKDGAFLRKHFEGCWPHKLPNGNYLLMRNASGTRNAKGTGYRGRQRTSRGAPIVNRERPVIEPVFLLIRRTSRRATLNFFNDAQAYFSGKGADAASHHLGRGLRAIGRELTQTQ